MPKLLVIADDLTGSLDTGIQFVKYGLFTKVATESAFFEVEEDTIVLDTESRHAVPDEAYYRVLVLTEFFKDAEYVYKKTDSTLRGNIGIEFKAILDIFNSPIFFIPAYPEQGRTTRNGVQYVDGKPVAESPFAKDPLNPVGKSFIPDIIREQADIKVFVVSKDRYEAILDGDLEIGVYVFDGETREDLERIGVLLKEKGLLRYTAGSAGFAETLAKLMRVKRQKSLFKLQLEAKPLIVVCGSINERSLGQIEYIKGKRKVLDIVLSPEEAFKKKRFFPKISDLRNCEVLIVRTLKDPSDIELYREYARANSINPEDIPSIISKRLGEIGASLLRRLKQNTIVVFGGDTFLGITRKLDIGWLYPLLEIDKGVVLSEWQEKYFITKAGGFGDEDVIERIINSIEKGFRISTEVEDAYRRYYG